MWVDNRLSSLLIKRYLENLTHEEFLLSEQNKAEQFSMNRTGQRASLVSLL